ncbi:MAG: hypothetical protein KUG77_21210 [Nannocystaceae bacterium]|nr:hypothetical protein [Nannocystaceae bacterium]
MTTHDNVSSLHAGLFARDGHLTQLTLDRFEVGELSTPMYETVVEHVEACETCSHRVVSMRASAVSLQPPDSPQPSDIAEARRVMGTLAIAGTVAAAAALLLMALPEPQQVERSVPEDSPLTASPYTTTAELEGAAMFAPALDFSVIEAPSLARIGHGDRVSWDAVLTLQVSPHQAGYVAVVSATLEHLDVPDETEELADTDGGGIEHAVQVLMPVTQLEARSGPHALTVEHASHLATEVADEQLMAIYCEESFELDDPFDPDLPGLREDCTSVELTLTRFGEVADS